MVKIEYFTIALSKDPAVYMTSEYLKGVVNLRVKERFKIRAIKLSINGIAKVEWHTPGKSHASYTAHETYIDEDIYLLTKKQNEDLYLEAGDHSYPFEYELPSKLPTSFEHPAGQIRYFIRGIIDIPWALDKRTTKSFTIMNTLDLNSLLKLKRSFQVSGQKQLWCWFCTSGPISANICLLKKGFVPGEAIQFSAEIENSTNSTLNEMTAKLIQNTTFHGETAIVGPKSRTYEREVTKVKFPHKILPRSSERWEDQIIIPPVCQTMRKDQCEIIQVSYEVVLCFGQTKFSDSKNLSIPIVIGTIPMYKPKESSVDIKSQEDSKAYVCSYEPCTFGANSFNIKSDEDYKGDTIESDSKTFMPFYPFYKDINTINQ